MLCVDFEDRLTDYLDGALPAAEHRGCAEHALCCPGCHDLLGEVRASLAACRASIPPAPADLEARLIERTAPETAMTCEEFEHHLTDYLDGFLPAALYHRWQRHAAVCHACTELPGAVVRSIGACYTAIGEPLLVPEGLHARILEATLGTTNARAVRPPVGARITTRLREMFDFAFVPQFAPQFVPQFAPLAGVLLVVVLVGTTTISDDGSIPGMYRAGWRLAAQTYARGAATAAQAIADTIDDPTLD